MIKMASTGYIMLVGQASFESGPNSFCKLVPICDVSGKGVDLEDFPNDGEVWWMLTPSTRELANPGSVVICQIEEAKSPKNPDAPTTSKIQAVRDSVRSLTDEDGYSVLPSPSNGIADPSRLVAEDFGLVLEACPSPRVFVRALGMVWGPFTAQSRLSGSSWHVGLRPVDKNNYVYSLAEDEFDRFRASGDLIKVSCDVTDGTNHRKEARGKLEPIVHEIFLASGMRKLGASNPSRIVLESLENRLMRVAKTALSRAKIKQFRELLEEIGSTVDSEERKALDQIQSGIHAREETLEIVTQALLKSGQLGEDRIAKAEERFAKEYIERQVATLNSNIAEELSNQKNELETVSSKLKDAQSRFRDLEERERTRAQEIFKEERESAELLLTQERLRLENLKREIELQKEALEKNLCEVTKEFREEGAKVLNRFIAIAPLLGIRSSESDSNLNRRESPNLTGKEGVVTVFTPPEVLIRPQVQASRVHEEEFFERFRSLVKASGFDYKSRDLARFHLSVKIGALTILGGPSGIGKSTLPQLYGRALAGDSWPSVRQDCLMVNVSPAWIESRDLLGYMSPTEGRFNPSESGLYQELLIAEAEHKARDSDSGVHLVCLDEMNLAQVEHYFGELMTVLERDSNQRFIRVFAENVAGLSCPFREYGTVRLAPSLRFVGTVNFDETTRLLSDRVLDRANLIELSTGGLPSFSGDFSSSSSVGQEVRLADFDAWTRGGALPNATAALLDELRPLFGTLGCPVSPRAYRSICRFVSSAEPVMQSSDAFDVQLTQRVLPRVRNVSGRKKLDALDSIDRILEQSPISEFEETRMKISALRDASDSLGAWGRDE